MTYQEVFKLAKEKGYQLMIPMGIFKRKVTDPEILMELTLIQKWLREEHQLDISVRHNHMKQQWWFYIETIDHQGLKKGDGFWFDSYEEGLLNGIQQTLKLLP